MYLLQCLHVYFLLYLCRYLNEHVVSLSYYYDSLSFNVLTLNFFFFSGSIEVYEVYLCYLTVLIYSACINLESSKLKGVGKLTIKGVI